MATNSVLAVFDHVDSLLDAAHRCKVSGLGFQIISPIPLGHEIEHEFGPRKKNRLRWFTGFGAINGFIFGCAVSFGTSVLYILPRGGKPILPVPPTLLIAYETSILFGVLFTLLGFFVLCRMPVISKKPFHPRIAVDGFGLLVYGVNEDNILSVEKILKEHGAGEIERIESCGC